jgi:hypothetical protein
MPKLAKRLTSLQGIFTDYFRELVSVLLVTNVVSLSSGFICLGDEHSPHAGELDHVEPGVSIVNAKLKVASGAGGNDFVERGHF